MYCVSLVGGQTSRGESLADAVNLKEKIDNSLEETSKQYQSKHIEILVIFFGLITLVMGALHIAPTQKTLFDALGLMIGLSLSLVAFIGVTLALITPSWLQKFYRFCIGTIAFTLLYIGAISQDRRVDQTLPVTQSLNDKSENIQQIPPPEY